MSEQPSKRKMLALKSYEDLAPKARGQALRIREEVMKFLEDEDNARMKDQIGDSEMPLNTLLTTVSMIMGRERAMKDQRKYLKAELDRLTQERGKLCSEVEQARTRQNKAEGAIRLQETLEAALNGVTKVTDGKNASAGIFLCRDGNDYVAASCTFQLNDDSSEFGGMHVFGGPFVRYGRDFHGRQKRNLRTILPIFESTNYYGIDKAIGGIPYPGKDPAK